MNATLIGNNITTRESLAKFIPTLLTKFRRAADSLTRSHREASFSRRRSLSLIISLKSTSGRISIGPSPYLKPGSSETS